MTRILPLTLALLLGLAAVATAQTTTTTEEPTTSSTETSTSTTSTESSTSTTSTSSSTTTSTSSSTTSTLILSYGRGSLATDQTTTGGDTYVNCDGAAELCVAIDETTDGVTAQVEHKLQARGGSLAGGVWAVVGSAVTADATICVMATTGGPPVGLYRVNATSNSGEFDAYYQCVNQR